MTTALKLPNNYIELSQEEMMYLDSGWGLPNWSVAIGINSAINISVALILGGGEGIAAAKAAIRYIGTREFTDTIRRTLRKFAGIRVANFLSGAIIGFIIGSGGWSIGRMVANWWDSRDRYRNNGWCDF